jgi:hypothetical protein
LRTMSICAEGKRGVGHGWTPMNGF